MSFWCITVIFNPSNYQSRINNYIKFRDRLEKQKINLLTIELLFPNQLPSIPDATHLTSNSIMWQKERLINYAISQLPPNCDKLAWLDADLLLPNDWEKLTCEKLEKVDFVQLFQRIFHADTIKTGIVWQYKNYKDWLNLRLNKKIYHAEPGFGWACKRSVAGIYDKLIVGCGDNFLVDCLLDSFKLHHYINKCTNKMLEDMHEWKIKFYEKTNKSVDYLPIDIFHLWHGEIKDRGYMTRDLIFKEYNYNPKEDIKLINNVWEWSSNKPNFHQAIKEYFGNRNEDAQRNFCSNYLLQPG